MTHLLPAISAVCALVALPALADTTHAPLTYEIFEAAVPHIDLDSCPEGLGGEDVFCRASIHHEAIHVFAFTTEGDAEMVGFRSYDAEGVAALLK